ncbi:Uncharacterised protein [Mycobacteroides abscessus subsp. bolletii]|uniref:hypothetical protein n=1 Tax=Mycobacteroides abscessus TaxID=36809 RepID=UPI0009A7E114|nr:hypothetical protein [Mycobacteroides abscessus]SKY96825.1 Uncharacterised protein [Mycobacteroides abscessus subsp. bolletii]
MAIVRVFEVSRGVSWVDPLELGDGGAALSAVIGLAALFLAIFLIGYFTSRQRRADSDEEAPVGGLEQAVKHTLADDWRQRRNED